MTGELQRSIRWQIDAAHEQARIPFFWGVGLWGVLIYASMLLGAMSETWGWYLWLGLSAFTWLIAFWSAYRRLG